MPLPEFNSQGELAPGVYQARLSEVLARFAGGSPARQTATASLVRIHDLAKATGKLDRLVIFGSYVTTKPDPNDVDVILVMADDFKWRELAGEMRDLFDHQLAASEFEASVFWVRPAILALGTLDEFIAHWQIKRDQTRRGIVRYNRDRERPSAGGHTGTNRVFPRSTSAIPQERHPRRVSGLSQWLSCGD